MNRAYKETIHSMKATGLASSINTLQTSHDKPVYRQSGSLTKAKLRSDNLFKIRCGELAEWLMAPVLKTGVLLYWPIVTYCKTRKCSQISAVASAYCSKTVVVPE